MTHSVDLLDQFNNRSFDRAASRPAGQTGRQTDGRTAENGRLMDMFYSDGRRTVESRRSANMEATRAQLNSGMFVAGAPAASVYRHAPKSKTLPKYHLSRTKIRQRS